MARKYTILKVIIQNFSKTNKNNKGFTLIELIVGLSIMLIVGGLAMNALIQASTSFNKDKRSIDSSQNMSTILEMIGNDIKQSGENINDKHFPAIEFDTVVTDDVTIIDEGIRPKVGSSKIIVRRALIGPLTLCDSAFTSASTLITVADNDPSITGTDSGKNCDVATSSSPLSIYRVAPPPLAAVAPATTPTAVSTTYYPKTTPEPLPTATTPLTLKLPLALRKLRDYRCNIDPNITYDSVANAGNDTFCASATGAKTRIAVANSTGQFLVLNQTDEIVPTTNRADTLPHLSTDLLSTKKYQIEVNSTFSAGDTALGNNTKNSVSTVTYPIGSPIYVIEERVYTLSKLGYLQLSINGAAPQTLTKKIDNFIVSARTYTNSTDRIINPKPAGDAVNPVATKTTALTTANPICYSPTTPPEAVTNPQAGDAGETNPQYICKFNYFSGVTATDKADWKTLAGIKVEIQTKYDGTGQGAEHPTDPALDSDQVKNDKKKLKAQAEFFPRNVLSK